MMWYCWFCGEEWSDFGDSSVCPSCGLVALRSGGYRCPYCGSSKIVKIKHGAWKCVKCNKGGQAYENEGETVRDGLCA